MNVEHIKGFTAVLGQPKEWNEAANGTVGGLPVRIEAHGDTISCTSAWKPSPDELAALLSGAAIHLRVIGGQPPVSISIDGVAEDLQFSAPAGDDLQKLLMIRALRLCSQQFALYAALHAAKGTAEGDEKHATNRQFATLCSDVLSGSGSSAWGRGYQQRIAQWMLATFGLDIAADATERNHRFLEEALELVQSLGCAADEAHQLVDYVFGRPAGEPGQEVGGTMVTLAALCNARGLDVEAEAEREHDRIWTKVEAIREKQKRKPAMGPLPGVYPEREA